MHSITVVVGTPRQLQEHWQAQLSHRHTLTTNYTLTTHALLADWLGSIAASLPSVRVLPLWDFVCQQLPSSIRPAPPDLARIYAHILPDHLIPNGTPVRSHAAAALIHSALLLQCEPQVAEALQHHDPHIQPLLDWMRRALPTSLGDERRVYQYAAECQRDTQNLSSEYEIYGFRYLHGMQRQWLETLSQRLPVRLWVPNIPGFEVDPTMVAWWSRMGAQTTTLKPPQATMPEIIAARSASQGLAAGLEVLSSVEEEWGIHRLVVESGNDWQDDVIRQTGGAFSRYPGPAYPADWGAWRVWLDVAAGTARRPETLAWLTSLGVEIGSDRRRALIERPDWRQRLAEVPVAQEWLAWAHQWHTQTAAALTWRTLAGKVREAWVRQPQWQWEWLGRRTVQWEWLEDSRLRPTPDLVAELLRSPPSASTAAPSQTSVVSDAQNATAVVADVALAMTGTIPPPDPVGWWASATLEASGLTGFTSNQDRAFVMASLPYSARRYLLVTVDPVAAPPPAPKLSADLGGELSAAAWYQTHRLHPVGVWRGHPPDPPLQVATPSQLELYGKCPYAYFLQTVVGLSAPEPEEVGIHRAAWGRLAHRILEGVARMEMDADPAPAQIREAVGGIVAKVAAASGSVVVDAITQQLVDQLSEAVWRHWHWWRGRRVVGTEVALHWEQAGLELEGRLDRVDQTARGQWEIIDYKTGAVSAPQRLTPANLQLPLYRQAWAVHQAVPIEQVGIRLVGVSQHNAFRVHTEAPDPGAVEALVSELATHIRSGRIDPIPHGSVQPCRTCAFRLVCPDQIGEEAGQRSRNDPDFAKWWHGHGGLKGDGDDGSR